MIDRRTMLAGVAAFLAPLPVFAQPKRRPSVAALIAFDEGSDLFLERKSLLERALAARGLRAGETIELIVRGVEDRAARRAIARDMVAAKPDVLFGVGSPVVMFSQETRTIPIVGVWIPESMARSLSSSFARPSGNFTGFVSGDEVLYQKWIDLLQEVAATASRIVILVDPMSTSLNVAIKNVVDDPRALINFYKLASERALDEVRYSSTAELRARIEAIGAHGRTAMILPGFRTMVTNHRMVIDLATRLRIPALYGSPPFVRAGGLMSYNSDVERQFTGAAEYVDKILKGEKAGDLPIQFSNKLDLVVNLKAAREIGLTFPPAIIARADEVIE